MSCYRHSVSQVTAPGATPATLLLALAATLPMAAGAAEWTRSAGIGVGSYYSSNICRAPSDEQGEVVGTLTPSVNLSGQGARADFALRAAAEYNTLADSGLDCPQGGFGVNNFNNREPWVPRVNFQGQIEAVEDFLFLESNAFAAQNAINPFVAGGDDNINGTGNQNITYRWSVGARIQRTYSEQWAVLARYNYNEQYNSFNQALGDSQEDAAEFDIGMLPEASRFSAGLRGRYSEVTFEETALQPEFTNRLSSVELRAALNLSRSWQLNGYVGEEDNVFLSASDEIDGSYWDVGVRWAPNDRVSVDAGWGERFFGDTPRFAASYRHKRSTLQAAYVRDIQFPRNIRGQSGAFDPDDPLDPGIGQPGEPLPGAGGDTFIGQGPVLNESFTLSYSFQARRTGFTVRASDSQQERLLDGGAGDFRRISASLSRSLGPSTSAFLGVGYIQNEGNLGAGLAAAPGIVQQRETWTGSAGLSRRLARNVSLALRYQYTDQGSDVVNLGGGFNTFEEHRITLSLSWNTRGR